MSGAGGALLVAAIVLTCRAGSARSCQVSQRLQGGVFGYRYRWPGLWDAARGGHRMLELKRRGQCREQRGRPRGDRRQTVRQQAGWASRYAVVDPADEFWYFTAFDKDPCVLRDLSMAGAGLELSDRDVAVGDRVVLDLQLGDRQRASIQLAGEVRHAATDHRGHRHRRYRIRRCRRSGAGTTRTAAARHGDERTPDRLNLKSSRSRLDPALRPRLVSRSQRALDQVADVTVSMSSVAGYSAGCRRPPPKEQACTCSSSDRLSQGLQR